MIAKGKPASDTPTQPVAGVTHRSCELVANRTGQRVQGLLVASGPIEAIDELSGLRGEWLG